MHSPDQIPRYAISVPHLSTSSAEADPLLRLELPILFLDLVTLVALRTRLAMSLPLLVLLEILFSLLELGLLVFFPCLGFFPLFFAPLGIIIECSKSSRKKAHEKGEKKGDDDKYGTC